MTGEVEYLTVAQLARRLGLSKWTLYSLVEAGQLPCMRLGRQIRFLAAEIDQLLRDRRGLPPMRRAKATASIDGSGATPKAR